MTNNIPTTFMDKFLNKAASIRTNWRYIEPNAIWVIFHFDDQFEEKTFFNVALPQCFFRKSFPLSETLKADIVQTGRAFVKQAHCQLLEGVGILKKLESSP